MANFALDSPENPRTGTRSVSTTMDIPVVDQLLVGLIFQIIVARQSDGDDWPL